jgi:hypothetical protein
MTIERMTAEQARELLAKPKRNKYRNIHSEYNGRTYHSRLEARHAEALDAQKRAGLIRGWLPQVSIIVPGTKRRMIIDFLVIDLEGRLKLQDTKGFMTKDWKLKAEIISNHIGIPIDVIRRTR